MLHHVRKESAGIPEEILVEHKEDCVRIPMVGDIRSLNLGNSVAIVLYEALRQNGFAGMNLEGIFTNYTGKKKESICINSILFRQNKDIVRFR